MKRAISILLVCVILFSGCSAPQSGATASQAETVFSEPSATAPSSSGTALQDDTIEFSSLSDPALLQYVEDNIHSHLEYTLQSDDFQVESVTATYVSTEYLEELSYNSQANIYFGYSLDDIEAQFSGERYTFTLGEDGNTEVKKFQAYDDSFNQIIQNIAIGSGVIIICATVSIISGGLGSPAVSAIFAASAKTGTAFAISSGTLSAAAAGVITGIQTNDLEASLYAAALAGSEEFKWGAFAGVITGGASKAIELHRASANIPTPREAELQALDRYGGTEQNSYLAGEEVPWSTPGSTRPDIVRTVGGHLEAIEVKNYDLTSPANRNALCYELRRQVKARTTELPEGATQRIVLNVQGRNYDSQLIRDTVSQIRNSLNEIYPNITIDIMR